MKACNYFRTFVSILCIQLLMIGQIFAMTDTTQLDKTIAVADEEQSYYYEAQELEKLGVFKGTNQGFELYREPSRLEALIMMMRMLGLEEEVLVREDSTSYFVDVPTWGYEYVNIAYERGLTQGVEEKIFGMDRQVDAKMFLTFMLRALNYDDKKGDFNYNESVEFALEIGVLDDELYKELVENAFTRNYVAKIVFNTLNTSLANEERTLSRYLIDEGKLAQTEQTKGPVEVSQKDEPIEKTFDELIDELIEEETINKVQLTPIMGRNEATADQLATYLLSKNPNPKINISALEFAQLWIDEGNAEGVRGDIAFAQACHETGFFKFGGIVQPYQNNYGGIGALNGNGQGDAATFDNPRQGVQASIQHLKAYGSKEKLVNNAVDPRFGFVTRGSAPHFEDLGGRWAWPGYDKSKYDSLEEAKAAGDSYGHTILKKYAEILRK